MVVCCALILCVCHSVVASGVDSEDFESPEVSWEFATADLTYRVDDHRRAAGEAHTGRGCEKLNITTGNGSYLYVTHAIGPSRIVDELTTSLWIKSNRSGLQIMARVVLPSSLDPKSGKPLTALVRGDSYNQAGIWQQLRIEKFGQLVERQVRVLRSQFGPNVDARGAYIDLLVLNVYGGQGPTTVWLDDLEITGRVEPMNNDLKNTIQKVSATSDARDTSPSTGSSLNNIPVGKPARDIKLSGSVLTIDGRPLFPRIIEYQNEPLARLAELGFNAVRLPGPPSAELLAEAEQAGIWLVSPPPVQKAWQASAGEQRFETISPAYDSVLAWSLGQDLAGRELESTLALSKQLRQADRRKSRPVICGPETELRSYSRYVDLLSAYRFPLSSSLEMTDYGTWLRERPRLARPGTPFWTVIQTQPSASLREQWNTLAGGQISAGLDPDAIRMLVYTTIGAGVRGLEFGSHSPLTATDTESKLRALTLAQLNIELELVEPWAAAGNQVSTADSNDPHVKGVVLQYDRSRLLIVTRMAAGTQYVPQHSDGKPVSFVVPGVPESHDMLELTAGGVRPLKHKRVTGGTLMTLEDFDTTALVLMTPDPAVVNVISRRLSGVARRAAELQRNLAALTSAQIELVDRQLPARVRDDAATTTTALANAKKHLDEAERHLSSNDRRAAYLSANRAMIPLGQIKRSQWERAAKSLGSTVASPFVASHGTLPEHWRLVEQLKTSELQENRLAAGDFENLSTMVAAGWRHYQHPQEAIETAVELSPGGMPHGKTCLRLEVTSTVKNGNAMLIETPPLWVTTPAVPVRAGELLCIRGRVRVSTPIRGSVDGLMIVDSLGGEALAERFGETKGWTDFVLYRAAPRDGDFTITFALTGFGEACLDDVTIRPLRAGAAMNSAPAAALNTTRPTRR